MYFKMWFISLIALFQSSVSHNPSEIIVAAHSSSTDKNSCAVYSEFFLKFKICYILI